MNTKKIQIPFVKKKIEERDSPPHYGDHQSGVSNAIELIS